MDQWHQYHNALFPTKTMAIPKVEVSFIFNVLIPGNDYKIVETLKIKMISIFGVTIVSNLIKILSGYRNLFPIHGFNFILLNRPVARRWAKSAFKQRNFYKSFGLLISEHWSCPSKWLISTLHAKGLFYVILFCCFYWPLVFELTSRG